VIAILYVHGPYVKICVIPSGVLQHLQTVKDKIVPAVTWDVQVVADELVKCLEKKSIPPQLIIGSDARFLLLPFAMLPRWLTDFLMRALLPEYASMKTSEKPTKGALS
jgi:hypothetical protein